MQISEIYYPILFGACMLGAILFTALPGDLLICILKEIGFLQHIREDGPASHKLKNQTPTAGGLIFVMPLLWVTGLSILIGFLSPASVRSSLFFLVAILLAGGIGFLDDYLKKVRQQNEGLKPRQKLLLQFLLTLLVSSMLARSDTSIFGILSFDLGLLFPVLVFLVIGGSLNAANLTDGMDGLASSVLAISYLGLSSLIFFKAGYAAVPGILFALGLAGACLGFLRHNSHPAKVFMGDTGSFLLGGGLAVLALAYRLEWYLLFLMMVPIFETVSVILQVSCAKFSRRFLGRDWRPFRMTPLHHHFELGGWSEIKVVVVMSGVQILSLLLLALLIRADLIR
ncbi:MAG: phospho-N-acetylmuramoyl-pentapeptide-transferase [Candidatus Caenarcaniphilales bacterium]|nr:phospho-N-acetylmuramoyl-pentapeptide-transferase [Candidatus Caenarcaniphilales bacterium]